MENSNRLRVMIADDVQEMRRSARLMLTLVPDAKVVAMAQNGREAVDLAREHHPDIALMDVSMPEMDGLTAIKTILQEQPDMVCVVVSAERESDTLREAMAVGARGYIIKPFTADQLMETFDRVRPMVQQRRQDAQEIKELRKKRNAYLLELAQHYLRTRRTDEKAMAVYEELAQDPDCDLRWLRTLAIIYVFRNEWGKLKTLATRIETQL